MLVSQGIETTIDYSEDESGWGLIVAPQDLERALDAVRLYRLENRGWPWQQPVFRAEFLFDWGSLAWAGLVGIFFWLQVHTDIRAAGIMESTKVAQGEWWRLFTATWLHADVGHLATNATFGVLLLGLAMGRFGTGVGLLAVYLAGIIGNVASWILGITPHASLGASGVVMGGLGLLAVQSVALLRDKLASTRVVITGVCAGAMLFVLLGLSPEADVLAHAGGFVGGIAFGILLSFFPEWTKRTAWNLAAGAIFSALVVLPWWLALKHRH